MDKSPDDPFRWDEGTLIERLWSLKRPCSTNLTDLAEKIREHHVDGQTLLTHEVAQGNAQELRKELHSALGVRSLGHKNALTEAIMRWRRESRAFSEWKRGTLEPFEDEDETQAANAASRSSPESSSDRAMETSDLKRMANDVKSQTCKKRRLVPELLQERPIHSHPVVAPTEADILSAGRDDSRHVEDLESFPWDHTTGSEYLGRGILTPWHIRHFDGPLSTQIHEAAGTLFTASHTRFPPGIRLVVSRAMQKLLLKNGRNECAGFLPTNYEASAYDSDQTVDLDDLASEYDDQTQREIDQDMLEAERERARRHAKFVPEATVKEILVKAVSEMREAWDLRKLPKLQMRAYKIWKEAADHGDRNERIFKSCMLGREYDTRIKKLTSQILQQSWERERDVTNQAKCLEQTLADKLHQAWVTSVLESRSEPPKMLPAPEAARCPRPTLECLSDEEILTSSEEDDIVVDDEEEEGHDAPYEDEDHDVRSVSDLGLVIKPETATYDPDVAEYMDLTELTPEKPKAVGETREQICIDLTTPIKANHENEAIPGRQPSQTAKRLLVERRQPSPAATVSVLPETPARKISSLDATPSNTTAEYDESRKIGAHSPRYWSKAQDRFRLTRCLLSRLDHYRRSQIFQKLSTCSTSECLEDTIEKHVNDIDTEGSDEICTDTLQFDMTALFLSYVKCKPHHKAHLMKMSPGRVAELKLHGQRHWTGFCRYLLSIKEYFPNDDRMFRTDGSDDECLDSPETKDEESFSTVQAAEEEDNEKGPKKAAKLIVRDGAALDLRERQSLRTKEQEARKARLIADLSGTKSREVDSSRIIINQSKEDHQPFIYVHQEISKKIKDHQVDGVRFLWNQILQEPEDSQGCLLAHTMGLGKTMQVITFLVAVQQAAQSQDPSMYSLIPRDLRASRSLVVCPAGLVKNWIEELALWDSDGLLGELYSVGSSLDEYQRSKEVEEWEATGGVLIIGYNMLVKVTEASETAADILLRSPSIVIADEAHTLKNPASKAHRTCIRFSTKTRIALSGSPLANNIEEYYFMINWIAPNFLGPVQEFRSIYAHPIQHGLWHDSGSYAKRKALQMLQVLKETVAPKVHRKTTKSCMRGDLPSKAEFVIYLSPTPLQARLYDLFIQSLAGAEGTENEATQGKVFAIANNLGLLCAHPLCFVHKVLGIDVERDDAQQFSFPPALVTAVRNEVQGLPLQDLALSGKINLLNQILDSAKSIGDKVLVFSQSIPTLDFLERAFVQQKRKYARLDGVTDMNERQGAVRKFNTSDQEVFLISTKAGGVGLNIQGANRVVIFDFRWNPVSEQQAIGRVYRIGQIKPVVVFHFVTAGTFEVDLQNKAVFKMQLASRVVDKKNPVCWSKRLGDITHPLTEDPAKDLSEFLGKDSVLDKLIRANSQGDKIKSIMSTETFEEEDPSVDLTVEERKEADTLIWQNRLRILDSRKSDRRKV